MSQPLLSPGPGGRCWSQWSLRRKSRRAQLQASSRDPGIRAAGRALRLAERGVHGHLCLGVRGVPLHPTHGSPRGKDEEEEGEGIPPSPFMTGVSPSASPTPQLQGGLTGSVCGSQRVCLTSAGLGVQAQKPVGRLSLSLLSPFRLSLCQHRPHPKSCLLFH